MRDCGRETQSASDRQSHGKDFAPQNLFVNYSENNGVDKYLSPVSGRITTIFLPAFSGRFASSIAAQVAAPEEIPTRTPSFLPMSLPMANASSFATVIISS